MSLSSVIIEKPKGSFTQKMKDNGNVRVKCFPQRGLVLMILFTLKKSTILMVLNLAKILRVMLSLKAWETSLKRRLQAISSFMELTWPCHTFTS